MNKPSTFKPVLIYQNRALALLQSRIKQHQQALRITRSALPYSLGNRVKHCVIKDHRLLIYTSSAIWASQMRFYSLAIQVAINANANVHVDSVQLRVLTQESNQQPKRQALIIPAADNIEMIRNIIQTAPDSKLKDSLLKLSRTLNKLMQRVTSTEQNS